MLYPPSNYTAPLCVDGSRGNEGNSGEARGWVLFQMWFFDEDFFKSRMRFLCGLAVAALPMQEIRRVFVIQGPDTLAVDYLSCFSSHFVNVGIHAGTVGAQS